MAHGRSFEEATLPETGALEEPGGVLDFGNAFEVERAASDQAQQVAEQGAELARKAGLQADALAVPHETTVADALELFANQPQIVHILRTLDDGYAAPAYR